MSQFQSTEKKGDNPASGSSSTFGTKTQDSGKSDGHFKKPDDRKPMFPGANKDSSKAPEEAKKSSIFATQSAGGEKAKSPFKTGEGKPPGLNLGGLSNKKDDSKPGLFGAKPADSGAKPEAKAADGGAKPGFNIKPAQKSDDAKKSIFGGGAKPADSKPSPFGAKDGKPSPFGGAPKDGKPSPFGAKPSGDNKEESKDGSKPGEKPTLNKPQTKISEEETIKKADLDDKIKQSLNSKELEGIVTEWYNRVESQTEMFNKHANLLKHEELNLYSNITTLESMNNYSERLIQDYGHSLSTMQEVAKQQENLLKVLDSIEKDVNDTIDINHHQNTDLAQRFRNSKNGRQISIIEKGNYRQQMDAKADAINTNLDDIQRDIENISKILTTNNQPQDNQSDHDEVSEVNRIVNQSYEALRWIEDTATDLNYQIQLIDTELRD